MAEELSIGLNLTYLAEDSGGSGTYAFGLIDGLRRVAPRSRLVGFVADETPRRLAEAAWADEIEWVRLPVGRARHPRLARGLWMAQQWGSLPLRARAMRLDVVHGLANVVPPLAPGVATVVTILDVIWAHFPRTMEASATRAMSLVAQTSARTADRVLTISVAAEKDIADVLGVASERIDVAYLAPAAAARAVPTPPDELRGKLGLSESPIVLSLAQKREHKNLDGLVRAFRQIPADAQLVLPGSPTPYEAELRRLVEELGLTRRVHFPGWLSDADVEGLYATAACVVLPSWIEGFGLPILEAMSRGVPVACSNTSSLPEVAGQAGALFDPADETGMAAAISQVLTDPALAADLVRAGYQQAAGFTWDATASKTLECYRRAIESHRG